MPDMLDTPNNESSHNSKQLAKQGDHSKNIKEYNHVLLKTDAMTVLQHLSSCNWRSSLGARSCNSPEKDCRQILLGCSFCLHLEASCLQCNFFTYNCVWELFLLSIGAFLLTALAFVLALQLFVLTTGNCIQ